MKETIRGTTSSRLERKRDNSPRRIPRFERKRTDSPRGFENDGPQFERKWEGSGSSTNKDKAEKPHDLIKQMMTMMDSNNSLMANMMKVMETKK